jgi:hypothetical protein
VQEILQGLSQKRMESNDRKRETEEGRKTEVQKRKVGKENNGTRRKETYSYRKGERILADYLESSHLHNSEEKQCV